MSDDKFMPVSSGTIIEGLRCGHTKIVRPLRVSAIRITPSTVYESVEQRVEEVADLAADRIEALEAELASMKAWQDELLSELVTMQPSGVPGENWMGWRLLCEEAREAYARVMARVGDEVMCRRRREFEAAQ